MKKKKKKNESKNKNVQDNRKKDGKKKKKETWTLLDTAYEKKKEERTDIFSRIDSTSVHRLKKEKKTEHFWTVIVILFWLVVKWNFLGLFEFKGDIRKFFFLFILWNLTKTINRGFYSRFNDIWNYIDSKFFF